MEVLKKIQNLKERVPPMNIPLFSQILTALQKTFSSGQDMASCMASQKATILSLCSAVFYCPEMPSSRLSLMQEANQALEHKLLR